MPCYNTAAHKRSQRVLRRPCSYTANAAKQRTGLYRGVSCNLPHSTAADTRPTQAAIMPPVQRWSVSQRRNASSTYQIPAPRRTLHKAAQPPIIIRYIRGQTMPAVAGQLLPCADRWQVLTRCQQYRPGAPVERSASPPAQGSARRGLDASHTRRLAVWHRVGGQGGRSGTLHPAGQSSGGGAARNHWRLSPHLFSGFRPIANKGEQ